MSPDKVPGNISLQVEAVKPDGSRVPMIRLNTRADWDRRYWFEKPMTLPRGTRVEVTANLQDPGHAVGGVHRRRPAPRRRPGARRRRCASRSTSSPLARSRPRHKRSQSFTTSAADRGTLTMKVVASSDLTWTLP